MTEKEIKRYIDNRLKKNFFDIKEQFDIIEREIDGIVSLRQTDIGKMKDNAGKQTEDKEYSPSLRKLIDSDMEYRHNKLMKDEKERLPKISSNGKAISYLRIAILAVFVLQIITFLK